MLTAVRWVLTVMLVTSLAGAAFAGFGDFGPDRAHLAAQVLATFIVAAVAAAFTLTAIEIVTGPDNG